MLRRLGHAVFAAFLVLFLLAQAGLIIAWIPSTQYAAIAAGTAYRLVDSVNSTALRIDQLGAGVAVSGTDQVEACQGCGSSTSSVRVALSAVATYITGVITGQQNAFVGQQLTPFALTNSSTISVNAANSNIQTIVLSSSGQTMGCPTGVSSNKDATLTFRIKQPASAGPDDLNWDTCYWFPAGTPPKQSNGGLSAANGAIDMVTCDVSNVSGTVTSYCPFNGSSNFASSVQFVLRNNSVNSSGSCAGTTNTCSVTISNSMAGDLRTVELFLSSNSQATSVTDGNNTCHPATNAFSAASSISSDIWVCPKIVGSTTATITATWPSNGTSAGMCVQEWVPSTTSPDVGIGNAVQGSGTSVSISTNGATTQVGQLVIFAAESTGSLSSLSGTQLCNFNSGETAQYSAPASLGVATLSATQLSGGGWSASIASFTHY